MFTRLEVNPKFEKLVRALKLDDFEAVMACETGQLVGEHRRRNVVRLSLSHGGRMRTVYLKREFAAQLKDVAAALLRGSGLMTKARREWEVITALQAEGVPCPQPLVFAQQGFPRLRGYLLLAELPGIPLTQWVHQPRWRTDRAFRRAILGAVADAAARLHQSGFDHPDLYSKHVWVCQQGSAWRVSLIDFQRSARYRYVPLACRWRDLAALNATMDDRWVSPSDRVFFLKRYLAAAQLAGLEREAAKVILPRERRLKSRRKVRELRSAGHPDAWDQKLVRADREQMWIDRRYQSALDRADLREFEAVMSSSQGTLLRTLPDRENWRLVLPNGSAEGSTVAYLKRHRASSLSGWLRRRFDAAAPISAGCQEAWNVMRLRRGGVASMDVIAFGEKAGRWGNVQSFLMTEAVPDAVPLDEFLRRRFGRSHRPGGACAAEVRAHLAALVDATADVARRFHALGYNHRDFYCCHFLVKEPEAGRFQLHLIDLQRMQYRQRLRHRWIVKDLAQLSYSAPASVVSATQRLRFLKRYLGVSRLGPREKRFVRQILAKHARIARRGIAP